MTREFAGSVDQVAERRPEMDKINVMLQSGLDIQPVITHRFHYTQFEKAFEVMLSSQSGKVIRDWKS